MESLTSMNFTVAAASNLLSVDQDMTLIKSALLYSDTITLASPVASTYFELTDQSNIRNEKALFRLIEKTMPFCEMVNPGICESMDSTLEQFRNLINSRGYSHLPMNIKHQIKNTLYKFSDDVKKVLIQSLGKENVEELKKLVDSKKVKLHKFKNSVHNDDYVMEFYDFLEEAVCNKQTFPLFDQLSNDVIKAALKDEVIILDNVNDVGVKHAKLVNELIIALPSFEYATINEILDIRKELANPLVRFRNKLASFNDKIEAMPWDDEFQFECLKLYQQEVAPEVLEIDELTKESGFIKNMGYSFLTDESALKNAGGLIVSIAMGGVISAFSDILSADQALITSTGAYAISKIAAAFKEYREKQNDIMKKDMYFYYKAGKILEKSNKL